MSNFTIKTTLNQYIEACISFSNESQEWYGIEKIYRTNTMHPTCWYESCDGGNGGIDVSWAFHKSEEYIRENACEILAEEIKNQILLLEENPDTTIYMEAIA